MSIISEMTHEELIDLNNVSFDTDNFFKSVSEKLLELGFVEPSFYDAINEREGKYPTGLELPNINIAIPHTDVEHIVKPFIFVNKVNSNSLKFIQMGTDDVYVEPEYVIVLGIKEPKAQVGLLSKMIELFNDDQFVENFRNAKSNEAVYNLFNKQ